MHIALLDSPNYICSPCLEQSGSRGVPETPAVWTGLPQVARTTGNLPLSEQLSASRTVRRQRTVPLVEGLNTPIDPDARYTRKGSAKALTNNGYLTSEGSLMTMASRGGGPKFRKFGARVIYQGADLIAWAEARTSPPLTCSADLAPERRTTGRKPRATAALVHREPSDRRPVFAE